MQLEIRSRGMEITSVLTDYCNHRIETHLGRFVADVAHITVRVDDINGTRGGIDKRVQMHVRMRNAPSINVETTKADVWAAIDNVAARIGAVVARDLKRRSQLYLRERSAS